MFYLLELFSIYIQASMIEFLHHFNRYRLVEELVEQGKVILI